MKKRTFEEMLYLYAHSEEYSIKRFKNDLKQLIPEKYSDYEQCTVGGHNETNCKENIKSKAHFDGYNLAIDTINKRFI